MIPSWQFSTDPGVNIKLNPHVTYPTGWTQQTIQPVGPAYAAARIANANLEGLGLLPRTRSAYCDQSCGCAPNNPCCCGESSTGLVARIRRAYAPRAGFSGLGAAADCTCIKEYCSGGGDCTCTEWSCPQSRSTSLVSRIKRAFTPRRQSAVVWGSGRGTNGMGVPIARMLGEADSWAYRNRAVLLLGGLGLVTAAGIGLGATLSKKKRR